MDNAWVFFYGAFMSAEVLKEHGIDCETTVAAKLSGFELSIRSRANLRPSPAHVSYGGLAYLTHRDIARLYDGLRDDFGIDYHPCPVIAELADGSSRPALCYLAPDIEAAPADPAYVNRLARCAKELDAPEAYIEHIKSFL